jgi:hypothetical protein
VVKQPAKIRGRRAQGRKLACAKEFFIHGRLSTVSLRPRHNSKMTQSLKKSFQLNAQKEFLPRRKSQRRNIQGWRAR